MKCINKILLKEIFVFFFSKNILLIYSRAVYTKICLYSSKLFLYQIYN